MQSTVKETFEAAAETGAHMIAQVKANQPNLHESAAALYENAKPHGAFRTKDENRRLRYEIRSVEVFLLGQAFAGTEWSQHVAAVIRVPRETRKQSFATGLWRGSEETARYIADFVPSAQDAAHAIRAHWVVENRLIRDGAFAEGHPNLSRDLRKAAVLRGQQPPLQRRRKHRQHDAIASPSAA